MADTMSEDAPEVTCTSNQQVSTQFYKSDLKKARKTTGTKTISHCIQISQFLRNWCKVIAHNLGVRSPIIDNKHGNKHRIA